MAGVSLVEAMITLAIVAVLVAVAWPGFIDMLTNLKVRSAAEKLLGGVQFARTEAIKRNQQVDFTIDSVLGAGWTAALVDGTVLQTYSEQEGSPTILLTTAPAFGTVSFNALGQRIAPAPAAGLATLGISNPATGGCQPGGNVRCLNVTVTIGGQARLCDPALTASDPTNPQAC
jgi:type IV fimbrial biogenesis protein FimT